jgi:sec-independent protein translocase protein TatB
MLDPTKLIIIAVVAFLFFGPDKLPEIARTVGRFMREFKKIQEEMETTLKSEMNKVDLSPAQHGEGATPPPAANAPVASMAGHTAVAGWEPEAADEEEEE